MTLEKFYIPSWRNIMTLDDILGIPLYSLEKKDKEKLLTDRLIELTKHHRENCEEYKKILDTIGYDSSKIDSYSKIPFLPVRLFKELSLKSVKDKDVIKTMTSSGTSGQKTSKIYLDKATSSNQQKVMVKIVSDFTGSSRMPMIIIDCPSVIKNRNMFSARGAGILGFSIFGSKKIYALDDDMKLDVEAVREFLDKYKGQRILLFGFTFMVWQYFYKELKRLKDEGMTFDFSKAFLIHGGGWKKLINEAVSADEFHKCLFDVCGLNKIHEYYGMVEQTGCIYMQCEYGHLHASIFSDVIARRATDFSECEIGEKGILQVVSTIPESYPGHSLLTEDEGVILGEDDCPCGRKGKYFRIFGRLKDAEIRGCSDTFAVGLMKKSELKIVEDTENRTEFQYFAPLMNVEILVGCVENIINAGNISPKVIFDKSILSFMTDLSKEIMKLPKAKQYPDVITLGFWLRKSSLAVLQKRFGYCENGHIKIGRGCAFHIAPSNVPVNYAYSLVSGLLMGNTNIVRVPSKDFPQVNIINKCILKTLEYHSEIKPYITLIRYNRDKDINDILSNICDVRVIWGGDETVNEIRTSSIRPRTTEIAFADRYSLALIDAKEYLRMTSNGVDENAVRKIALDFYNDTYLSDQNACSSPRLIAWIIKSGSIEQLNAEESPEEILQKSKEIFWKGVYDLVSSKYSLQPIQAMDKLTTEYLATISWNGRLSKEHSYGNFITRIKLDEPDSELMDYRGNSGYFYECDIDDIMRLQNFCDDTHCQTIAVLGDSELVRPLFNTGIKGVDRVVPFGHTMDFDLVWDGYNLVDMMSRMVKLA